MFQEKQNRTKTSFSPSAHSRVLFFPSLNNRTYWKKPRRRITPADAYSSTYARLRSLTLIAQCQALLMIPSEAFTPFLQISRAPLLYEVKMLRWIPAIRSESPRLVPRASFSPFFSANLPISSPSSSSTAPPPSLPNLCAPRVSLSDAAPSRGGLFAQ